MSKMPKSISATLLIVSALFISGCAGIGQELRITKSVSNTPNQGEIVYEDSIAIMVVSPSYQGSQLGTKHLSNQLLDMGYGASYSYLDDLQFSSPEDVAKKALSERDALIVVTNGYANGYVSTGAHCNTTGTITTHSNTAHTNASTQCQQLGYSYSNDDFNVAVIKNGELIFQGSYATKFTDDGGAVSVVQSIVQYDPTQTVVRHILADMEQKGVIFSVTSQSEG